MKNYLSIKNFIFLVLFAFLGLGLRWPLDQTYPTLFGYSPVDYTVNSIQAYRINNITDNIELRLKQKKLDEIETDLTKLSKLPIDPNELDKLYVKYYIVIAVQCIDKRDSDCLIESTVSLKKHNYTQQDQLFLDEYFFHKHSSYIKELFEQIQSKDSTYSKLSSCQTLTKLTSLSSSLKFPEELPSVDRITSICKKIESQQRNVQSKSIKKKTYNNNYSDSYANYGSGSVLCRDGTLSKSCVCGGSYRGCCSRHGGVAGCY